MTPQQQISELQSNVTLAIEVERAIEAIRALASQMAPYSDQAQLLQARLGERGGSLREADITLALSVLAQAVVELRDNPEGGE